MYMEDEKGKSVSEYKEQGNYDKRLIFKNQGISRLWISFYIKGKTQETLRKDFQG